MTPYALIVDPDAASASMYAALARAERLAPVCVRDGGAAATQLFDRGPPALMIVDPAVAHLDGFELIERLRRAAGGEKAAVVVVSADRDLRERAVGLRGRLAIGAVLAKAVSDDSAKRVIQRLLVDTAKALPTPQRADSPPAPRPDEPGDTPPDDVDADGAPARSSWATAVRRHLSGLTGRRRSM
jgi:DNA-binding response OmpR family regulator